MQKTILITRPKEQAERLSDAIIAHGDKTVLLPTLQVEPILNNFDQDIFRCDLAIFISPVAVQMCLSQIPAATFDGLKICAIGSATVDMLSNYKIATDYCPKTNFNSEGLLALTELQSVNNKQIIIVRGEGGRHLLKQELQKRGAKVHDFICYRRIKPEINQLPDLSKVTHTVCTSAEGLENLVSILQKHGQQNMLGLPLIVSSQRLQAKAKEIGFNNDIIMAKNASIAAIMATLNGE